MLVAYLSFKIRKSEIKTHTDNNYYKFIIIFLQNVSNSYKNIYKHILLYETHLHEIDKEISHWNALQLYMNKKIYIIQITTISKYKNKIFCKAPLSSRKRKFRVNKVHHEFKTFVAI